MLVKILIVGLGSIGTRHLTNILTETNNEVIIYTKRSNTNTLNKKNVKIFHDLKSCIFEKPDIAFITNETTYHIPIAKKLAKLGLDLFIENVGSEFGFSKDRLHTIRNQFIKTKTKLKTRILCCRSHFNCVRNI